MRTIFLLPLQYDCFSVPLRFGGVQESWWNDRHGGAQRYFWAGDNTNNNNSHTCQCGIDKNCIYPSSKCNCDTMAILQRKDTSNFLPRF